MQAIRMKLPYTYNNVLCHPPSSKSLSAMASKGIIKANFLFAKLAPPKSAMAAIGVKLKGWGSNRLMAASKMAIVMNRKRGVIIFDGILFTFVPAKIIFNF